jgi:hypothetical protein
MSGKQKSGAKPIVWRPIRHFEFNTTMPPESAMQALTTSSDAFIDIWIKYLTIQHTCENADFYRFTGQIGTLPIFEGYMKALPDGTTLVSGKVIAHLSEPEPLPFEEEMKVKGQLFGYLIVGVIILICGFSSEGVVFLSQACLGTLGFVFCLGVPFIIVTVYQWYVALLRRDDVLLAIQNRLGVELEVLK